MTSFITVDKISDLKQYGLTDIVITCGVFDGLHLGHQHIIDSLLKLAEAKNAKPVMVTFYPHPKSILFPEKAPKLITVHEQKKKLLKDAGLAAAVFIDFSTELAMMSPEEFFHTHLLNDHVRIHGICVGSDWRFGAKGRGNIDFLKKLGTVYNFEVASIREITVDDRPISSTRIRRSIQTGNLTSVKQLLGRPYTVYGHVAHGKGMGGKTFSCPTANLNDDSIILPPEGVYAARATVNPDSPEQHSHEGIVYIGKAPTVKTGVPLKHPILELHLFNSSDNLYELPVEVEFIEFIRPDETYPSIELLKEQIARDIEKVKSLFKKLN